MSDTIGIQRESARLAQFNDTGVTANVVSQNNPPAYEGLVEESYLHQLPQDSNTSTLPELDNGDDGPKTDLGDLYDRFNSTSDSFEVGLTEIFSVLHEAAVSLRKSVKEVRGAEREIQQNQLQEAADRLRSSATFAMVSGIVGGSMQIAGGAMSIGGAASSGVTAFGKGGSSNISQSFKEGTEVGKLQGFKNGLTAFKNKIAFGDNGDDIVNLPLEQRIQFAQTRMGYWSGTSQVMGGVGQTTSGALEGQGKFEESEKAKLDAQATKTAQQVDDSNQLVQDLAEMVREVRTKLAELEAANNETIKKSLQV